MSLWSRVSIQTLLQRVQDGVLGPSLFYSPFLQHPNFLILLLRGTSLKDAFASLNLPNLFLNLQIQHPVTASSPTVPVGFFSVCFTMTFSSTVYPQVLVGLAATLGQRLWKAVSDGSVHLSESDCAGNTAWYHSSPHYWAVLLLWLPRISVSSQSLHHF